MEDSREKLHQNLLVDAIFRDLSKVLNCTMHDPSIRKLAAYQTLATYQKPKPKCLDKQHI